MESTNSSPQVNNSFLQFNTHSLKAHLKSVSTITVLATGVLGAMAATYYDPARVILGIIGLGTIQFLTLPELLKNSDHALSRLALVSSFAAFGSLVVGASATFSYQYFNSLIVNIFAHTKWSVKTETLLLGAWALTAFISYGIPLGYNFLQKAYTAINDSQFKEKLLHLVQVMRNTPSQAGFIAFIKARFELVEALILPERVLQRRTGNPQAIATIHTFNQQSKSVSGYIEQLKLIEMFVNFCPSFERPIVILYYKPTINFLMKNLAISLNSLKDKELDTAIDTLMTELIHFVPRLVSTEQFSNLFKGKAKERLNNKAEKFVADFNKICRIEEMCQPLAAQLSQLETEIVQYKHSPNKAVGEQLSARLATITKQFTQQRKKIESLYQEKQRWKLFTSHPNLSPLVTRFNEIQEQVRDRLPGETKDKLQAIYQGAIGIQSNSESQEAGMITTVANTIQRLTSQLASMDEDTETSAWLFLATNCQFVAKDYEDLKKWLKVSDLGDIEAKFEEIGLKSEQDLYDLGIVQKKEPSDRTPINKEEIRKSLAKFIEMRLKGDIRSRIYSVLSTFKPQQTSLSSLSNKVIKVMYRLMMSGLVLVPMIIYPKAAAAGLAIGIPMGVMGSLFHLERYTSFTTNINESNYDLRVRTLLYAIEILNGRRFFNLTPQTERSRDVFAQSGVLDRIRIINTELFLTMAVAFASITFSGDEPAGAGGVLQGIAVGLEAGFLGMEKVKAVVTKAMTFLSERRYLRVARAT